MIQHHNFNDSSQQILHTSKDDNFTYEDKQVKLITVLSGNGEEIALVEDEDGELFEVPRDSLR